MKANGAPRILVVGGVLSMVRPAWSDFTPADKGDAFPVNFRLEAWVQPFAASLQHSTD